MLSAVASVEPFSESEFSAVHPMDSSRMLMSLLSLVQSAESEFSERGGLISRSALRDLLSAVHYRDAGTLTHVQRVAVLAVGIASRLGWEPDELRILEIAGLLHDLGKLGIPDHILRKPGKLSPDEAEYIAVHQRTAEGLLQACRVHSTILEVITQSHGWDDRGQPSASASTNLGARILAVADAYDSLTTRQVYRPAYSHPEALKSLHKQSGRQFDRNVVAALARYLESPEAIGTGNVPPEGHSLEIDASIDAPTRTAAVRLCQIFNYLYLLETLYEAYYVVDSQRRVVLWNSGAVRLFGHPAATRLGRHWDPRLISNAPNSDDAVARVFHTGGPYCQSLTITDTHGNFREIDRQAVPITAPNGSVAGVVELFCDRNSSKQHHGQFRKLQLAASRDPLTTAFNRGELERQLSQLHDAWQANSKLTFCVIFFDLDHFKAINDNYSHSVGDRVLVDVVRLVQDELYSGEIIGRYGGEEFVILCPETPLGAAADRADRLRRMIHSARVADRDDLHVTASFGVAQAEPEDDLETILKRADDALYEAKRGGRNQVCTRTTQPPPRQREQPRKKQGRHWHYETEIVTCVAADMLPFKLRGFVEEHSARLELVTPQQVVLTIGSAGLLGGWGRDSERQPVRLTFDIEEPASAHVSGTRRIRLATRITPIGRPGNETLFRRRAHRVVQLLRSYLIAD
jgi:diguanylate cyclase (GGDEF)-like protein